MTFPIPLGWRQALAAGLVALPATASAQDRNPFAPPPQRPVRTIEIIHGTTRVWPVPQPARLSYFPPPQDNTSRVTLPPPRLSEMPGVMQQASASVTETHPQPEPPPRTEISPKIEINLKSEEVRSRAESPAKSEELRPIILTTYTVPYPGGTPPLPHQHAPWLTPAPAPVMGTIPTAPVPPVAVPTTAATAGAPAVPAAPAQPTVVVIREPAPESRPMAMPAEPAHGITIGNETLLGFGIGAFGLGIGLAGRRRRAAVAAGTTSATAMPGAPPPPSNGVLLLGKYNAGPLPTTAEQFEIGPSYQHEQQEKKKVEAAKQDAVLEFILSQNIALHAELGGAADDEGLPDLKPAPADAGLPDLKRSPDESGV